ncbi:MAG: hypothetical protein AD742_01460 [Methylibium sp. NZG]|nr:MAG: hypothetical protein AD742_01460 [Methylibium sp. NZG]
MTIDSLSRHFNWRCHQQPDALAYAMVRDTLELAESLSYGQLHTQVLALGARIARHSQAGDRVLLVYPAGLDFVRAFWACMLTGRIAVPVPAPDPVRFKNGAPRLLAIIEDAGAALVLTTADLLEPARAFFDEAGSTPTLWLATDGPGPEGLDFLVGATNQRRAGPVVPDVEVPGPHTVAYLQYTSGSTATPRGVVLTHANVLAQCRSSVAAVHGVPGASRCLCWLPHHHDYGLVFGVLAPFHHGLPSYLMSPVTFLRRPLRWLEAVARFGITHTGGPNFAYAACIKALAQQPQWQADLRTLVSATCGAEPIQSKTGRDFEALFGAHGLPAGTFAASYGMAETVLTVTTSAPATPLSVLSLDADGLAEDRVRAAQPETARRRDVVGCGRLIEGMRVRIVHPKTRRPCEPDAIGEVWVQGTSVGQGYWQQPNVSDETFRAHLADGDGDADGDVEGPWLRTGDLGFVHDSELYITGRLKDLIIVRGRNHAPQDIEWTVQRTDSSLRAGFGAAFSIDTSDGEALVVVQEMERRGHEVDLLPVIRAIRKAVAAEHELPVHAIALVRSGSVPRTSSGKIQRQRCRRDYLEGKLQVLQMEVAQTLDALDEVPWTAADFAVHLAGEPGSPQRLQAIEQTLVQGVARFTRQAPQAISLDDSAIECGLDSLSGFRLLQVLETALGRSLPPAALLGEPSLRAAALRLDALLADPEQAAATAVAPIGSIAADERRGLLPLSAAQQRMWFWQELAPGTALYTVPVALALHGPLDAQILQASLQALLERHEVLRTRWVARDSERFQRIEVSGDWRMRQVRLDELPEPARTSQYETLAAQEAAHGFDLCAEFGVRAVLVRLGAQDHRLLWTLHHSVCDGWSMGVLMDELCLLYDARSRGLPAKLPRQELQYLDFAAWEARSLDAGLRERELAYWKQQLADAPPALALPTDHHRPARQRFRGATLELRFDPTELAALRALARRNSTTLFMTVLALWQTLLHRHSGQATVITGSVIANRERREFESVVGYLANTLALRSDFADGLTVAGLLAQVKATALAAYAHQHVPFEEVVDALHLPRDASRTPLIQTFVVLQPPAEGPRHLGDVRAHKTPQASPVAKFDLTLELQEAGSQLVGCLEYDTDLFERATVERMAAQLHTLAAAMCADAGRPVAELPLLGEAERRLVLNEWNNTARPYALHVGMHTLIEQQAQRTPLAVAVAFAERRLSYDELNARANRLAHHLRRLGVGPDTVVGVCLERSIELVVSLLAVLKAGGAFLPLDAELPPQRLQHMLDDARAPVVLTHSALLGRLPATNSAHSCHPLCVELPIAEQPGDDRNPASVTGPEHLAYIIYTSGSTGQPKGVMVPHRALSNHTLWSQDTLAVRRGDRLLQKTTIGFDAAIQDFFVPLQAGATIVLAPPGEHRDTGYLVRTLREERITLVSMVPAQLRLLLDEPGLEACVHLRHVVCGGEALGLDLAQAFRRRLPNATLGNFYGPSETTIDATHCVAQGDFGDSATVPIGRPIANAQCYVLDAHRQPVPIGATGELCIGGAGLAHGYLNRPDLTAERFIDHPFAPGQRVYRTGDLVRWLPDGRLEYLGRSDFQVKVRGIRIELGEIEAALHALPSVRHCTVVAREDSPGLKRLVAYVVGRGVDDALDADTFRQALLKSLPEAMMPSVFVSLPHLPLLPNGKVDRHALPAPGMPRVAGDVVAPRTPLEQAVATAWQDALQLPPFGVHDNFFQLGGHSLLAMQVISRLRNSLHVEMPLRALFDAPTVAQLAEWIAAQDARAGRAAIPKAPAGSGTDGGAIVPMTAAQQGLWLVERLQDHGAANPASAETVGNYNIVQATRLRGPLDRPALERSLQRLCERHDSLHMGVVEHGGVPALAVRPDARWPLQDLSWPPVGVASHDEQRALQALLDEFANRPFDLAQAPLARAGLVRLGEQQHVVLLVIHHIVGDGWSLEVLLAELAALYKAERDTERDADGAQRMPTLAPLPLQWRDVALWERSRAESGALDTSLAYWTQQLQGLEPLRLPAETAWSDDPNPLQSLTLPADLVQGIETLARHHNATVFMTLLAAFKLLLMRRFGQQDVAVGTPVAGRDRPELESLVGLLLNTLVLRTDLGGDPSFAELLRRVRTTTLDAWAHQDVPFDRLVAELAPARDADHTPFFDVLVNSFGRLAGSLELAGLDSEPIVATPSPKFALSLYIQATPGAIGLAAVYRTDRFSAAAVRSLLEQFSGLLQQVVAQPSIALSEVSLLTPAARVLLADPALPLPAPPFTPVIDHFVAHARRSPSHLAVRHGGVEHDYAALHHAASVLAQRLQNGGLVRGDVVAICGPRSAAVVAAMLAALMSGAVFVTLDPALPAHRREIMLREARARWLVLVGRDAAQRAGPPPADVRGTLVLDTDLGDLLATGADVGSVGSTDGTDGADGADGAAASAPTVFAPVVPLGDDPAYIFFTSGSTGTPKAVLGRHRGLSHFLDWQRREFAITPQDRVSQLIGLSFDPLLRDVFLPLISGATLCIPQDRDQLDPIGWLVREAVSVVHSTPTVLQSWLQGLSHSTRAGHELAALRWLFVAGEPLTDALVGAWRARFGTRGGIVNLYGPTETTMARCFHVLDERLSRGIQPVGRAVPDSQALVLSAGGQRCGIGEVGEVVLRTPLRSLGYLGLPEENRRRFRTNPWRPQASEGKAQTEGASTDVTGSDDLLYFTGDLGRFRTDGVLEIAGRLDDQVKIRGVRVEPAEVMAALARHPRVRHCVVVPQTDDDGRPMLVAYVAPVSESSTGAEADLPLSAGELRSHLASQLPEAFVPGAFVFMDTLPTQANGKIDRKRLPPRGETSDAETRPRALVMPRSPVEQALWDIWRNVLKAEASGAEASGVESFGVFESFFALGGHSLLATQVIARVRDVLGVELPLRALFDTPTLAGLAAAVEQQLHAAPDAALPTLPAIQPVPRDRLLPTSYSQRRMWMVQQFNPSTTAYNMPFAVRLRGPLDREVLAESLQCLVARHEAFRTTLVAVEGEPMQRIGPVETLSIEMLDLSELPEPEREADAAKALNQRSSQPYDLAHGPLHRPTLVRLADDDHVLFWSIHHAIGDGWSAGILLREIAAIYPALVRGQEPTLPPMAIDFADYADWQRRVLGGSALANQLAFWKQALAGLEPLPLPLDRPRRGENNGRGAAVTATFAPQTLTALKALAVQHGVTPYMALLACFQLLLARHCDTTDVAVGTPIANRTHVAAEHLVGTLVNTVVMRTDLAGDPSFAELLKRVRETALQAYAHQDLPFEALVEALAVSRSDGAAPLVQVLFNVLNAPQAGARIEGLVYEPFEFDTGSSQFDLALSIDMQMFGAAHLSFSTEVFELATGQRLLKSFMALVEQVLAGPDRPLSAFALSGAEERAAIARWNHTPLVLPAGTALVHAQIAQQARRTPARLALRCGDEQLSHAELQSRALRLARALRVRGVARGSLVGLCLPRGADMVVAQLAILHSGAAYVPLDPAYPSERLAHMAQDAALALIVSDADFDAALGAALDWPAERLLRLDRDAAFIATQPAEPLEADEALDARPGDPAYVIYTSGSTGRPKGVVLPHEAVVNFLASMAREPGLEAGDVLVAVTTLSFDIAVLELLLPLFVGATVVLALRDEATDGRALRTLLEANQATVMQATPSTWRLLIDAGWPGRDGFKALIGGEGLPPDLAHQLLARTGAHGALWNLYGPTETTVWSTGWKVVHPERGIRIGRPIGNTQIHVLDAHGQPCPIGVAGEVFIGGAGVAIGYLNRPELTAERFVPDPFSATPGARLYRTGDRGRWCHDGQLEHLGRLDFQVKVRGHRIELGEIEAALGSHPQVVRATVIVREDRPGDVRLVAYVVTKLDVEREGVAQGEVPQRQVPTPAALREHLRGSLPVYMLPQHIVPIDAVPLLPNGKVDRHALPMPESAPDAADRALAAHEAPQTEAEKAIAAIWQALLGTGPVGLSDNFFDLGGHSLLAMRAVGEMERRVGIRIALGQLVHESLAQIAAAPAAPPGASPVADDAQVAPAPTALPAAPEAELQPAASGLRRALRSVRDLIGS